MLDIELKVMKYIIACFISIGLITSSMAQTEQEMEMGEEEGTIACFFIDEETIACFQEPLESDTLNPSNDPRLDSDTTQVDRYWDMDRKEEEEYNEVQTMKRI